MGAWDRFTSNMHGIAATFARVRHSFADDAHTIAHAFDTVRHDLAAAWPKVASFLASIPGRVKGFFSGAGSWLTDKGTAIINGLLNGAKALWSAVSGWFAGLPGRIKSAIGNLGGLLLSAGESIMQSLYNGLTGGVWGKIKSFMGSVAGILKSLKGPLDYDRVLLYPAGQYIMQGLMDGVKSRMPALEGQFRGITHDIGHAGWVASAGPALAGSPGGSAGFGGGHAALAGGGGETVHQVNVFLNGRQIYSEMQREAVGTQRRSGSNGMQRRTR
jgi:phage-related protein